MATWWSAGLDDEAIEDVANIALHFNIINRAADALDFPLADEKSRQHHFRFLNRMGNLARARRPDPPLSPGPDGVVRPVEVNDGRDRILSVEGSTEPQTRRDIEAWTAALAGAHRPPAEPPELLLPYLDKLTRHAYRIVDDDIDRLRAAGFDDEAIFEITLAGALGAALPPLERVCELLAAD